MIYVTPLRDFSHVQVPGGRFYPFPFQKSDQDKQINSRVLYILLYGVWLKPEPGLLKAGPYESGVRQTQYQEYR